MTAAGPKPARSLVALFDLETFVDAEIDWHEDENPFRSGPIEEIFGERLALGTMTCGRSGMRPSQIPCLERQSTRPGFARLRKRNIARSFRGNGHRRCRCRSRSVVARFRRIHLASCRVARSGGPEPNLPSAVLSMTPWGRRREFEERVAAVIASAPQTSRISRRSGSDGARCRCLSIRSVRLRPPPALAGRQATTSCGKGRHSSRAGGGRGPP